MAVHGLSDEEVLDEYDVDHDGLSESEAQRRLEEHGPNKIEEIESPSALEILVDQFRDYLVYILMVALLLSVGVGVIEGEDPRWGEAIIIGLILVGNGLFGFYQDYRAEQSIAELKQLAIPDATVIRDGSPTEVDATTLVPGDILRLDQGDAVPADARLLESESLACAEAALTGESTQVSKKVGEIEEATPVAEQSNMVFKGTDVVRGRGIAVVVETGMDTEIGAIAGELQAAEKEKTPFEREVDEMGRRLSYLISGFVAVIAVIQAVITGTDWVTLFLLAIGLVVAAIPEALPVIVTFALALGSRRMLERNALVRRLPVVESLGSVNYILTDKTGTLTRGTMTVQNVYGGGQEATVTGRGTDPDGEIETDGDRATAVDETLRCGVYCNNATQTEDGFDGSPTETALLVSGLKAGIDLDGRERVRSVPFSSDRKRMTTVMDDGVAYMKGAPGAVLERCNHVLIDGEKRPLTDEQRETIEQRRSEYAGEALRVLAFAKKPVDDPEADEDAIESDMVFLGLQAMIDPPRQEVTDAIADCRTAGISVVMATGDDPDTAQAIGAELGFAADRVVTGPEVEEMSEDELTEAVQDVEIFARVSPKHKVKLLRALKDQDLHVAMTGDGVNDAPALKNADVGIAMGQQGTAVAKKSSDIILQDDNFVTIRDAIAEGRAIFDNIRKVTNYLLSTNAGEVMFVFLGSIIGALFFQDIFVENPDAVVLTAVMILWVNFVTDGPPAIALAADDRAEDVMDRPPREAEESIIDKKMIGMIAGTGPLAAIVFLPLFFLLVESNFTLAQTTLFTALAMFEILMFQVIRREYGLSILSNRYLGVAVGVAFLAQLVVLYTPLRNLFEVLPLGLFEWGLIAAGLVVFGAIILVYQQVLINRFGQRAGKTTLFSTSKTVDAGAGQSSTDD